MKYALVSNTRFKRQHMMLLHWVVFYYNPTSSVLPLPPMAHNLVSAEADCLEDHNYDPKLHMPICLFNKLWLFCTKIWYAR